MHCSCKKEITRKVHGNGNENVRRDDDAGISEAYAVVSRIRQKNVYEKGSAKSKSSRSKV
jgi:hypothetical protein